MERKFGVEIEFFGVSWNEAQRALELSGIPFRSRRVGAYDHIRIDEWKLVRDSSVYGTTIFADGMELVSPPLFGQEGLNQLKVALRTLRNVGARVNRTCGLHVHVDAAGMTVQEIKHLVRRYAHHESAIDAIMPASRRGDNNAYCASMRSVVSRGCFQNMTSMQHVRAIDRMHKLNISAYLRHGTVEFRHHSGSLNYAKIRNWVMFCQNFVQKTCEFVQSSGAAQRQSRPHHARARRMTRTQLKIVAELQRGPRTVQELVAATGCTPNTVVATISQMRSQHGCQIKKRAGMYRLLADVGVSQLSTHLRAAHAHMARAQESYNMGTDPFEGLSRNVLSYYQERVEDMAS